MATDATTAPGELALRERLWREGAEREGRRSWINEDRPNIATDRGFAPECAHCFRPIATIEAATTIEVRGGQPALVHSACAVPAVLALTPAVLKGSLTPAAYRRQRRRK